MSTKMTGTEPTKDQLIESLSAKVAELSDEKERLLDQLNTMLVNDFDEAVPVEAAHQIHRWGSQHDAGKNPEDWFWLVGYLAGKALRAHIAGDKVKALHHTISTSAALRNWHSHIKNGTTPMRPGIAKDVQESIDGGAEESSELS